LVPSHRLQRMMARPFVVASLLADMFVYRLDEEKEGKIHRQTGIVVTEPFRQNQIAQASATPICRCVYVEGKVPMSSALLPYQMPLAYSVNRQTIHKVRYLNLRGYPRTSSLSDRIIHSRRGGTGYWLDTCSDTILPA
jgi:hypothetical protein